MRKATHACAGVLRADYTVEDCVHYATKAKVIKGETCAIITCHCRRRISCDTLGVHARHVDRVRPSN